MNIRSDFPVLQRRIDGKKIVYFDNACSVLKPQKVIDSINYYYSNLSACGGARSSHDLAIETNEMCEKARNTVANFINSKNDEIVWTKNTTEGINLVAQSLKLKKDDEIICSELDHHSNILPFYDKQQNVGCKLSVMPVDKCGEFDLEIFKEKMNRNVKLVSFGHVSNVTGTVFPMKEICEIAHDNGACVLSDEAQQLGHDKIDVKNMDVDFCAFSSLKIGGPTGIGALYVKEDNYEKLDNFIVGGNTISDVSYEDQKFEPKYLGKYKRFEAGLQNYAGIIGFGEAVRYIKNIGIENIIHHENNLVKYSLEKLKECDVDIIGPLDYNKRKSIVSFVLKNEKISSADLSIFMNSDLENHKVMFRTGAHCVSPFHYKLGLNPGKGVGSTRLSFFAYNEKDEVDIFIDGLKKFLRLMKG